MPKLKIPKVDMPDLEGAKKLAATVTKTLQHAGQSAIEETKKAAATAGTTLQHAGESAVEESKKAATVAGKQLRKAGERISYPFKNPISLNLTHFRGFAEFKFCEERLPFIFEGTVNYTYCDNNVKMLLLQGSTPEVAAIYGGDDPKKIRITRNDLHLPERLLRYIYSMVRHRVIIASQEERGFDPSKRLYKKKHSYWDYYNSDKKRVLKQWDKIKKECLTKIRDYQNCV